MCVCLIPCIRFVKFVTFVTFFSVYVFTRFIPHVYYVPLVSRLCLSHGFRIRISCLCRCRCCSNYCNFCCCCCSLHFRLWIRILFRTEMTKMLSRDIRCAFPWHVWSEVLPHGTSETSQGSPLVQRIYSHNSTDCLIYWDIKTIIWGLGAKKRETQIFSPLVWNLRDRHLSVANLQKTPSGMEGGTWTDINSLLSAVFQRICSKLYLYVVNEYWNIHINKPVSKLLGLSRLKTSKIIVKWNQLSPTILWYYCQPNAINKCIPTIITT